MEFKARLNLKFYIVTILLLAIVLVGWYAVYKMSASEIQLEDGMPMDNQTQQIFIIALCIVLLSWTFSLFALLRQIFMGQAFLIDKDGIHSTVTAVIVLSLIFVIPIRTIPYSAIKQISDEDGILTLHIDKTKLDMLPFLRLFATGKYHFFKGFTKEKQDSIKAELDKFLKQ